VACQAVDQAKGVFAGDAAVVAAGGDRHLQSGAGAALPDDLHLARPGGVVAAVVLHGDGDLGDDRADEFLALHIGGGRGLEDGSQVGAGVVIQAVSCSVRVTGRRARWAASWFSAVRTAMSLSSRTASTVLATSRFSGSTLSYWRCARPASKRARSSARSNTARFWRNWAWVSYMAWMVAAREAGASAASSSARTVSWSRRPPARWQDLAPYIRLARPHR
jgi:hypothetical protein